jgi:rhodanese-related sulfurtransferase
MAYLYGNDPEKFYLKFLEEFNIISLRRRGIIDPDVLLKSSAYIFLYDNMKRSDAELWALRKAGFSNRGLVIIYGFKNLNSIYVKFNRLSKRVRL